VQRGAQMLPVDLDPDIHDGLTHRGVSPLALSSGGEHNDREGGEVAAMRAPQVAQQTQDPAVDGFSDSIHALTEVWMSMMVLTTSNQHVIAERREIARWARNTNQSFMDTFGRATASEEIRVILDGLQGLIPKQLGDAGRGFLVEVATEARALATEGTAAIDAI